MWKPCMCCQSFTNCWKCYFPKTDLCTLLKLAVIPMCSNVDTSLDCWGAFTLCKIRQDFNRPSIIKFLTNKIVYKPYAWVGCICLLGGVDRTQCRYKSLPRRWCTNRRPVCDVLEQQTSHLDYSLLYKELSIRLQQDTYMSLPASECTF